MKRTLAWTLVLSLALGSLSGCAPGSAAPEPLSAQPIVLTQEELQAHDLEAPAVQSALPARLRRQGLSPGKGAALPGGR